jgi:hypothetical protein
MVCTSPVAAAVEVAETEEHGKALVSTACLKPGHLGLLVFREESLLTFPIRGSKQALNCGRTGGPTNNNQRMSNNEYWTCIER